MGKILKYCSSCDEGFAERFTFCPDCGSALQAFEMNPVGNTSSEDVPAPVFLADETIAEPEVPAFETAPVVEAEPIVEPEPIYFDSPAAIDEVEEPVEEAVEEEEVVYEPAVTTPAAVFEMPEMHADEPQRPEEAPVYTREDDGGYYVTVIQEKNSKQRNVLLLGATFFTLTVIMLAWLVSLFQKDMGVASIGDETSIAYLLDEVPMVVEEKEPEKKNDDEGGGGGGGGREDKEPVSQGDLADQSPNPTRPPDAKIPRLTNPSLELPPPQTQGNMKFEKKYDRWGDPNAAFGNLSNGPGTGGGMGSGTGTGQGSGTGSGAGSGTGSGYGGGVGDGNGNGTGSGTGGPPPAVKPVTQNYRIISRPKATYTDEARQKNVQGAVRLKITLLASGQVGPITPVTRLPYGLTEQAIAAARRIQFEPKKVNGVPQSIVITYDYTFTIY